MTNSQLFASPGLIGAGNKLACSALRRCSMNNLIPIERIESHIFVIRGQKVMLDKDLAELYQVKTKNLNKAIKRNLERFPIDFMFQLNAKEIANLRFQFGTSSWGGLRYRPYAFTEQGVAMLSSVLNSKRAIQINIQIMRAFTRLRQILSKNKDLTYLFRELKHKVDQHDIEIGLVIRTIEKMIAHENKPKRKIGFVAGDKI
jgi:phage regulator Rha-like protein